MQKRVQIIDFNHMAYNFFYSQHRLSTRVLVDGDPVDKDTTIQNNAIKNIFRWSNKGLNPTAVCFDRKVVSRKVFWQTNFQGMEIGSGNEYKGNREKMPDAMYEAIQDCENILRSAGVAVFAQPNYEADDLIFACIQYAKKAYPDLPIDVITNDADLLPVVDNQVSVFLRSKKGTWAENKDIEKNHYMQITPDNYQEVVEDLSAYKGFMLPYNTLLLHKMLRGDKSDQFGCKDISRLYSPKRFNEMMIQMLADGVDLGSISRYSPTQYDIVYKDTGEIFNGTLQEALASPDKARLRKKIIAPENLTAILECLAKYSPISEEQLERVKNIYFGMNLNQAYSSENPRLARKEFIVGKTTDAVITQYDAIELQKSSSILQIRLNLV